MRYIAVDQQQNLLFCEDKIPEISADECLIQVNAIGVNRADLLQRAGHYPAPKGESTVLGLEVSGDIIKKGYKVNDWLIGDKVFALVAGGAYAEFVKVKASQLLPLPKSFTYQQGAAVAEVFLTAYQSLISIAQLKHNANVLIHAGASGVGTAAIQLAKNKQCRVVVTVSTQEKAEACLKLGADDVINYKQIDFVQWSKTHMPSGFDVIIDVVSGSYLNKNIDISALDGHIVVLSILGGRFSEPVDLAKLLQKRLTLSASTLRNRDEAYKAKLISDFSHDYLLDLIEGKIIPVIDSIYHWSEANKAHSKMENNQNIGKIVLNVN